MHCNWSATHLFFIVEHTSHVKQRCASQLFSSIRPQSLCSHDWILSVHALRASEELNDVRTIYPVRSLSHLWKRMEKLKNARISGPCHMVQDHSLNMIHLILSTLHITLGFLLRWLLNSWSIDLPINKMVMMAPSSSSGVEAHPRAHVLKSILQNTVGFTYHKATMMIHVWRHSHIYEPCMVVWRGCFLQFTHENHNKKNLASSVLTCWLTRRVTRQYAKCEASMLAIVMRMPSITHTWNRQRPLVRPCPGERETDWKSTPVVPAPPRKTNPILYHGF